MCPERDSFHACLVSKLDGFILNPWLMLITRFDSRTRAPYELFQGDRKQLRGSIHTRRRDLVSPRRNPDVIHPSQMATQHRQHLSASRIPYSDVFVPASGDYALSVR